MNTQPGSGYGWMGPQTRHDAASGWTIAAAVVGMLGLVLVVFTLGIFAIGSMTASPKPHFQPPVLVPRTEVLVNDRKLVEDERWTTYRFHLSQPSQVSLELDVENGDGITAHLMAASDYAQFARAQSAFFGGSFLDYTQFRAQNVRRRVANGVLGQGDYVLVVKEVSDTNILGAPDTALTQIRVVASWQELVPGGGA